MPAVPGTVQPGQPAGLHPPPETGQGRGGPAPQGLAGLLPGAMYKSMNNVLWVFEVSTLQ